MSDLKLAARRAMGIAIEINAPALSMTSLLLAALLFLAGCHRSDFEPPEVQGPAAMVEDGGQLRLWVLSKQEEVRQVGVGGGGPHNTMSWRSDTYFHFAVQAFDPLAAKPLWKKLLLTLGDPDASGPEPSRVIGSNIEARLLGQDGNIVWLLIGDAPFAVNAADGSIVADGEALQRINSELKGLLPSESRHYSFDRGLVLMSADARQFVVRGPGQKAVAYTPAPPVAGPEGQLLANGTHELVPMLPIGEVPARQVTLGGQWLGLYSETEAADISDDAWGKSLRWPYSVINEGARARRTFWHAKIVTSQHFDDRFQRLADLTPIAGAPTFLKGRFLTDRQTGAPLILEPAGVLVWHSTRIDDAGRLALTRLDADLKTLWKAELPLSETDIAHHIAYWQLPGHIVVVGEQQIEDAGVTRREPHVVSIDLDNGASISWDLTREAMAP